MRKEYATEYKGWTYIHSPDSPMNKMFQIETNVEIKQPAYLYKYYGLSDYNIDAVEKNYLYASSHLELNDPFDSMNNLVWTKNAPLPYLFQFYEKLGHSKEEIRNNPEEFRNKLQLDFALWLSNAFGILSLTNNPINTQMWAYYASNHHGFAIKFKLDNLPEKLVGPFPINYQDEWEAIDINIGLPISFLFMTNIKSTTWKHEQEWRYIGVGKEMSIPRYKDDEKYKANRKFNYSLDAIDEIILGWMFRDWMIRESYDDYYKLIIDEKVKYEKQKLALMNFIVNNNIRTSMIGLKEGSQKFELDIKKYIVEKSEENVFIMKELIDSP